MTKETIELREITKDNVYHVIKLTVKPEQQGTVATNSNSLAEAYVYPDRAWPRAICLGDKVVGFVMLDVVGPDHPEAPNGRASYYVWRFMIGGEYQGKGYGRVAMNSVVEHVRTLPAAEELTLSYQPDHPETPGLFYEKLGFEPTGEIDHGEVVMRISLSE